MWLTQVCPWRYLYLSAELGEHWASCGWLRCVLGGVCTFLQNLVKNEFMWLTQVCPWNLFLEVSIPFCKTWCKCGEFHVADSDVSLESCVPFYRVWWTVSFMWLTQVCPWNLSLDMCVPFCRTWWTASFMWLTQVCPQSTKLEEHPWRRLNLSAELANSVSCGWLR